jgi:hypothetical protein
MIWTRIISLGWRTPTSFGGTVTYNLHHGCSDCLGHPGVHCVSVSSFFVLPFVVFSSSIHRLSRALFLLNYLFSTTQVPPMTLMAPRLASCLTGHVQKYKQTCSPRHACTVSQIAIVNDKHRLHQPRKKCRGFSQPCFDSSKHLSTSHGMMPGLVIITSGSR